MIQIPILGALALGAGTVLERTILKNKKIKIGFYQTISFLSIILIMSPLVYFFWGLNGQAFELKNILLFIAVVISAIIANLLVFYSQKWEKVTNTEPARILEPLFVVLLAIIFSFFTEGLFERNLKMIVPTLIAAVALVFPHIKRHHLSLNKYIISAIFGSFFFAVELILSRMILNFYSPITFYFLRCVGIFLISFVIFRPKIKLPEKEILIKIVATAGIWIIYRVAVYYGYLTLGVIFTTLIVMLGAVFVYLFAFLFAKEKINWKNIISAVVIIACVVYTLLS
ncbi:MAG: DMT family transporter [Candidatus Pacearchaeota archaeon]|nr:DMT family transporter [Candidatus Pacearchaeota archaeon]